MNNRIEKQDRSNWQPGPWDSEPQDYDSWVNKKTGYACEMIRNFSGAWCGYVDIPSSHSLFGKDYGEINVEVHGGLTFSNVSEDSSRWKFGFDCAHASDLYPAMPPSLVNAMSGFCPLHYRTADWVKSEVNKLAEQLWDLDDHKPSKPFKTFKNIFGVN